MNINKQVNMTSRKSIQAEWKSKEHALKRAPYPPEELTKALTSVLDPIPAPNRTTYWGYILRCMDNEDEKVAMVVLTYKTYSIEFVADCAFEAQDSLRALKVFLHHEENIDNLVNNFPNLATPIAEMLLQSVIGDLSQPPKS